MTMRPVIDRTAGTVTFRPAVAFQRVDPTAWMTVAAALPFHAGDVGLAAVLLVAAVFGAPAPMAAASGPPPGGGARAAPMQRYG